METFRRFEAGPDPYGRTWRVEFRWLQTAVSIRHSDSVDVKFVIADGDTAQEKIVSLRLPDLLELSRKTGQPVADPWCARLAALHLRHMIETGEDMEKTLVTVPAAALEALHRSAKPSVPA